MPYLPLVTSPEAVCSKFSLSCALPVCCPTGSSAGLLPFPIQRWTVNVHRRPLLEERSVSFKVEPPFPQLSILLRGLYRGHKILLGLLYKEFGLWVTYWHPFLSFILIQKMFKYFYGLRSVSVCFNCPRIYLGNLTLVHDPLVCWFFPLI